MSVQVTFTDDDKLYRKILREVAKINKAEITVGVHSDTGTYKPADGETADGKEPTIAYIASCHEFGKGHNPERSFLRFVEATGAPMKMLQEKAAEVCHGELTARQACEQVGLFTVGKVKERIRNGPFKPLNPDYEKRKLKKGAHGSGLLSKTEKQTILVDTGQLIASITHKVTGAAGWGSASASTKAAVGGAA